MAFSLLYLAVRALLSALVRSRRGLHVKDIELLRPRAIAFGTISSSSCRARERTQLRPPVAGS
jgi:hypothetical protein